MKTAKFLLPMLSAGLLLSQIGYAHADAQGDWLKKAQLGPHAPAKQDWKAIEAAARKEGKVTIYSVSSRTPKLAKKFKEKYGVEIEAFDISSDVQLEKMRREHKAGVFKVDVLFNNETPLLFNEFLPKKQVWRFVPDSVSGDLEANEKSPLLVQRWSSRVLFYNKAKYPDGAPIDNLWDLTRKEWKKKLLMPSPLEGSVQANVLQTILQHPDKMAAAYKAEFGEKVKYSKGLKKALKKNPALGKADASKEWLYRLLKNKPIFLSSTTKIFKNVADVKQDNPPLGITTFSKMRKNKKGVFEGAPAYNVKPVFGVSYPTTLSIADRAPHPNAAKLLIRYMMEKGFKPWNVIGDYAARANVEKKQTEKYKIPLFKDVSLWNIDQTHVYDTKYTYLKLYLGLRKYAKKYSKKKKK
jgi:iron(III) transport system substrate-binding protein